MNESQATKAVSNLTPSHLYTVVQGLAGYYPNPEDDNPPGPWDPVIRIALEAVRRMGPFPEPWRTDVPSHRLSPDPIPWRSSVSDLSLIAIIAQKHPEVWDIIGGALSRVGLNPQPLPPRYAFVKALAESVIQRAEMMQEIADAMDGSEKAIIVVGGRYVNKFTDDICPPYSKIRRFPKPWPPPPDWYPEKLEFPDYAVIGASFDLAARTTFSEPLRAAFAETASNIAANAVR